METQNDLDLRSFVTRNNLYVPGVKAAREVWEADMDEDDIKLLNERINLVSVITDCYTEALQDMKINSPKHFNEIIENEIRVQQQFETGEVPNNEINEAVILLQGLAGAIFTNKLPELTKLLE